MQRRKWMIAVAFIVGCSTAPLADTLDWVDPGRARQERREATPPGPQPLPMTPLDPVPNSKIEFLPPERPSS